MCRNDEESFFKYVTLLNSIYIFFFFFTKFFQPSRYFAMVLEVIES